MCAGSRTDSWRANSAAPQLTSYLVMWTKRGNLLKALCALSLVLSPWAAQGTEIGLFADRDCTTCKIDIAAGQTDSFYVRFNSRGLPESEFMTGANFRIAGLPANWVAHAEPAPGGVSFGELFDTGASLAFSASHAGPCVDLYVVTLTAPALPDSCILEVTHSEPGPFPGMSCPLVSVVCSGGPCDTRYCADGGRLFVNTESNCTLGVRGETWSAIKDLFR